MKNTTPTEIREIMKGVNIDFPSVAGVDRKLRAQVLNETAKALILSTTQGWITNSDAGQEFINLANKFGMELSAVLLDDDTKNTINSMTGQQMNNGQQLADYMNQLDYMLKKNPDGFPDKVPVNPNGVVS